MGGVVQVLAVISAVGSGLVGGVFFGFSTFVMQALRRLPSAQGLAAMQAINVAAPNAWFMAALFGTALSSIALAGLSLRDGTTDTAFHIIGAAIYLVVVIVTAVYHVPRNNALATVDPEDTRAASAWNTYFSGWHAWNHLRTVAGLAASAVLTISLT
jgi:uncharacterized membrane protein